MIVTTLVENSTLSKTYKKRHGLSIHLNVNNYNILFDLGADGTFIENARKLDINIEDVDIVIISHGHKDHGGGLEEFLRINYKAKIYINKYAFESYYTSVFKYGKYTMDELKKALPPISSIISKSEKAYIKSTEGTSTHSRLRKIIKTMSISKLLIDNEINR